VEKKTMEERIRGGDNFVFSVFLYLEPVKRFENMVRIGEAATTARTRAFRI